MPNDNRSSGGVTGGNTTVDAEGKPQIPSKGGSAYSRLRAYRREKRRQEGVPPPHYSSGLSDFHKGGKVKKTGVAKVHKGEVVLSKSQAKHMATMADMAKMGKGSSSERGMMQKKPMKKMKKN